MRTKQSLTLADVKKMMAACEAKAAANKWVVDIAIDDGGLPARLSTRGRRARHHRRSVNGQGARLGDDQAEQVFRGPHQATAGLPQLPRGILLQAACQ